MHDFPQLPGKIRRRVLQFLHSSPDTLDLDLTLSAPPRGLSRALSVSSRGDEAMATALRAIYLKLEDIDKKLVLLERAKR